MGSSCRALLIALSDESLAKVTLTYTDDYPCREAAEALEKYLSSKDSIGTLGDTLLRFKITGASNEEE